MKAIYYLGPEGTFSHILARKRFGKRVELRQCATIEEVIERTAATEGARGLVPVENSSGGTIHDSIDLLIRLGGRIAVIEELSLDVRIALLARARGSVRVVFSHFTQIKHHADWLRALYPKARLQAVASTGVAATLAASTAGGAALAAPGSADIYGLRIVDTPKTDHLQNVTHFYVIRSGGFPAAGPRRLSRMVLVAALPNACGSLHAFLGPFARHGISLSRIVSRPVPGQPQTYVFFVEIEGDPADAHVVAALASARRKAVSLTSLGAFPYGRRFKS